MSAKPTDVSKPGFWKDIIHAYNNRAKAVIVLSGNVHDTFPSNWSFAPLQTALFQQLQGNFTVVEFDAASGITFRDKRDLAELERVITVADSTAEADEKIGSGELSKSIASSRHSPLPGLVTLRSVMSAVGRVRRGQKMLGDKAMGQQVKPVCLIVHYAGALFPSGELSQLAELDRQRLVTFLSWINDPLFASSDNLTVLIADSKEDINKQILAIPASQAVEVDLPDAASREKFLERRLFETAKHFASSRGAMLEGEDQGRGYAPQDLVAVEKNLLGEISTTSFVQDTAGLRLTAIEDLLEGANRTGEPITRTQIVVEVNKLLAQQLGGVVTVTFPTHGPKDLVGSDLAITYLRDVLKRCDDPKKAFASIIVPGSNGAGKTFIMEALANESGRIVVELTGLRGMYFGQTDRFFEMLRLHFRTYGRILVLVDEAHTAFGSVHSKDTHETEKRLGGNIIKMMSDPRFKGKVVWVLMTSRPDQLDPDIISRAAIQIPIFDPEGEEREKFVAEYFKHRGIELTSDVLATVIESTMYYSKRDFNNLITEIIGSGKTPLAVIAYWRASAAIAEKRRFQMLVAANHCTYPQLLPKEFQGDGAQVNIDEEIESIKYRLRL